MIPDWLAARRATAAREAEQAALPTAAQEVWRYSPIDELDLTKYAPIGASEAAPAAAPGGPAAYPLVPLTRAALVIVRDDAIVHIDCNAEGVTITPFDQLTDAPANLGGAVSEPDALTLRNDACSNGVLIKVDRNAVIEAPVVVVHDVTVAGSVTYPRVLVETGQSSQVTVLDVSLSADVDALILPVVELHAGQNATLRYQSVQALGPQVWQVGYTGAQVERDAHLTVAAVALGGAYGRNRLDSKVLGPGAEAELVAAYFGSASQIHDFRTLQDHKAGKTSSDLLFKGVLTDTSRSTYSGLIRIRKGAAGAAAFQTNRNLVLGEGAHADSVPNLEIEENDVKCSHASAVGPVDQDQLYYLEARGIPTDVAERLIVFGFFDDVLERMPVAELRPLLKNAIAEKFLHGGVGV